MGGNENKQQRGGRIDNCVMGALEETKNIHTKGPENNL